MKHTLFIFLFAVNQAFGMESADTCPPALRVVITACQRSSFALSNGLPCRLNGEPYLFLEAAGQMRTLALWDEHDRILKQAMFAVALAMQREQLSWHDSIRQWVRGWVRDPDWEIHPWVGITASDGEGLKLIERAPSSFNPESLDFRGVVERFRSDWSMQASDCGFQMFFSKERAYTFEQRHGLHLQDPVEAAILRSVLAGHGFLQRVAVSSPHVGMTVFMADAPAVVELLGLKFKQ